MVLGGDATCPHTAILAGFGMVWLPKCLPGATRGLPPIDEKRPHHPISALVTPLSSPAAAHSRLLPSSPAFSLNIFTSNPHPSSSAVPCRDSHPSSSLDAPFLGENPSPGGAKRGIFGDDWIMHSPEALEWV